MATTWQRGVVARYNSERGYGFIKTGADGVKKDIFFHYSALEDEPQHAAIYTGFVVDFCDVRQESRGLKAYRVKVVERPGIKSIAGTLMILGHRHRWCLVDKTGQRYYIPNHVRQRSKEIRVGQRLRGLVVERQGYWRVIAISQS